MDDNSQPKPAEPTSPELELPVTPKAEPSETPPKPKTPVPDSETPVNPIAHETTEKPSESVEPAKPDDSPKPKDLKQNRFKRIVIWAKTHKKWSIPLGVLVLLAIIFAIPATRYPVSGLVLKQNITVEVTDSINGSPVSDASVLANGVIVQTDGSGKATLHLKVGQTNFTISKKYYATAYSKTLVPILSPKHSTTIKLEATGRQVKINVVNYITQKALSSVSVKVLDITSKTDSSGNAVLVLPANTDSQSAVLSLSGYTDKTVTIQINSTTSGSSSTSLPADVAKQNQFSLTPVGKVYYLSDASGTLNVVSSNLDGTGTKVILAGTGNEEANGTTLAISPDNNYIALLAKRTTDTNPQLYIINGLTGAASEIDHGDANFYVNGWLGDNLVYEVDGNNSKTWQAGLNKLKSYNAVSGKTTLLSQSSATGDSTGAAYETYNFVTLSGNSVIFGKQWQTDYQLNVKPSLTSQNNTLNSINVDGSNNQVLAKYNATGQTSYTQYSPTDIYILQQGGSADNYYDYQIGNASPSAVSITNSQFYKNYPYYYFSPNGQQTFWSETRDGQNTLLIGDSKGANSKVVASLTSFNTYGWFNDQYLLVNKDSTLYVMGIDGGTPLKVANYQVSSNSNIGIYGGGGGGY